MKKFLSILIGGLLMSSVANAEIVTYEGVGQYVMSDFETPDVAKLRAKQRAEKSAQEKAGIFVKSNTKVVNLKLESEEIEVMTAGIMKVNSVNYEQQFDTSGNGIIYTAKVLVDIDTDEIDKWLEKSVVEKEQLIEQNKTLQKTLAEQEKQLAELKARLEQVENANLNPGATFVTRMQFTGAFANSDNIFLSNEKLKEGNKLHSRGDLNGAITAYTDAITLNANNAAAYTWRGNAFGSLGHYQNALSDLSRAVQLDNSSTPAYVGLGLVYYLTGDYMQAIQDFTYAISLDSGNAQAYRARAASFRAIGDYAQAQQDEFAERRLNNKFR